MYEIKMHEFTPQTTLHSDSEHLHSADGAAKKKFAHSSGDAGAGSMFIVW
jgi:hypothetical protein